MGNKSSREFNQDCISNTNNVLTNHESTYSPNQPKIAEESSNKLKDVNLDPPNPPNPSYKPLSSRKSLQAIKNTTNNQIINFTKEGLGQIYQRNISLNSSLPENLQNFNLKSKKPSPLGINSPYNQNINTSFKKNNNGIVTISTSEIKNKTRINEDPLSSIGTINPIISKSKNTLSGILSSGASYLTPISAFSSTSKFIEIRDYNKNNENYLFSLSTSVRSLIKSRIFNIKTTQNQLINESKSLTAKFDNTYEKLTNMNRRLKNEHEKLQVLKSIGRHAEKTYELIQEVFHDLERLESLLPPEKQLMEGDSESQENYKRLVEALAVRKYNSSSRLKQNDLTKHRVIGKYALELERKSELYQFKSDGDTLFKLNQTSNTINDSRFSTVSDITMNGSYVPQKSRNYGFLTTYCNNGLKPDNSDIFCQPKIKISTSDITEYTNSDKKYQTEDSPQRLLNRQSSNYQSTSSNKISPVSKTKDSIKGFLPSSSTVYNVSEPRLIAERRFSLYESPTSIDIDYATFGEKMKKPNLEKMDNNFSFKIGKSSKFESDKNRTLFSDEGTSNDMLFESGQNLGNEKSRTEINSLNENIGFKKDIQNDYKIIFEKHSEHSSNISNIKTLSPYKPHRGKLKSKTHNSHISNNSKQHLSTSSPISKTNQRSDLFRFPEIQVKTPTEQQYLVVSPKKKSASGSAKDFLIKIQREGIHSSSSSYKNASFASEKLYSGSLNIENKQRSQTEIGNFVSRSFGSNYTPKTITTPTINRINSNSLSPEYNRHNTESRSYGQRVLFIRKHNRISDIGSQTSSLLKEDIFLSESLPSSPFP
ncbi:hypothetical protein BB559_005185 [Furculomyces boomerangus]|uniref:BLOC-1-related complex subunit 5 n=1 Tax=Furculomyces boomerangus TaxID=61424 RepID=A0A2T9YA88_9FUNG|nr:hypothetical protein BB559_005185 [Furculomyces boomerangus]